MDKTFEALSRQIAAMACDVFEIGLFNPDTDGSAPAMLPRTWDAETLLRSVAWLRKENRDGRNIYVRPKGEHRLSLVDDLTKSALISMKHTGFGPALVVETSPGNYQAWLKHPEPLNKEVSTAAARALAERFGGDRGAADWRHFGRLAGFTNRKQKYQDPTTGLYPFVRLIECDARVYKEAPRFLDHVKRVLEDQKRQREQLLKNLQTQQIREHGPSKSIDVFRSDPKYGGDGTRIDLAYAIYALSSGASESEVSTSIRTRDLSHKGTQKRQDQYVDRTIRKASAALQITPPGR